MLSVLVLLVSCAKDDVDENDNKQLIQLIPYRSSFTDAEQSARTSTRAIADGYEKFSSEDADYPKIAIYLATAITCGYNGNFTHNADDTWTSSVYAQPGTQYYVYGYMPDGIAPCTVSSDNYTQGATLTLSNLSPVSTSDVCAIVGVLKGSKSDGDIATNSLSLVPGNFSYQTSADGDENYMYLLLDHIYSRVNLQFAVDSTYDSIRTIKVTNVQTQTLTGPQTVTAKIELKAGSSTPMTYTLIGDGTDSGSLPVTIFSSETTLTPKYQAISEYCTPGASPLTFNVVTTYDVYDKKGYCVRKNCSATNKITLPSAVAGKSYNIFMKVIPTYLYQLSDPDLDNPTIVPSQS